MASEDARGLNDNHRVYQEETVVSMVHHTNPSCPSGGLFSFSDERTKGASWDVSMASSLLKVLRIRSQMPVCSIATRLYDGCEAGGLGCLKRW